MPAWQALGGQCLQLIPLPGDRQLHISVRSKDHWATTAIRDLVPVAMDQYWQWALYTAGEIVIVPARPAVESQCLLLIP